MPTNREIVQQYMEKIVGGDLEGALALATEDAIFQGPDGTELNKDQLRGFFAQLAPLMINPLEQEIVGTTCEGDRVAVEAKARTMLANGNLYSNLYHFLFELKNGRIVRSKEYCNTRATDAFC
jgi:ketosteroid isomerase-like protein